MKKANKKELVIEGEYYEKEEKKVLTKGLKTILVILYFFAYSILVYVPFLIFNVDIDSLPDVLYYTYHFVTELALIVSLIYIYQHDFKKYWDDFKKNGIKHIKVSFNWWFIGIGIMIISNLLISSFSPIAIPENEEAVRSALKISPIFMALATVIEAPIIEEILFRKTIYDIMSNKKLYVVVSGLIFGAFHIIGTGTTLASWLYIIPYAALGMSFAYIFVKTKNLLPVIFIHAFHNLITIVEIFLLF